MSRTVTHGVIYGPTDGVLRRNSPWTVRRSLEVEELPKAFGLGAAYGDFGLLAIVHAELVAGFEPGDYFADVLDVDDEGAVGSPELLGV